MRLISLRQVNKKILKDEFRSLILQIWIRQRRPLLGQFPRLTRWKRTRNSKLTFAIHSASKITTIGSTIWILGMWWIWRRWILMSSTPNKTFFRSSPKTPCSKRSFSTLSPTSVLALKFAFKPQKWRKKSLPRNITRSGNQKCGMEKVYKLLVFSYLKTVLWSIISLKVTRSTILGNRVCWVLSWHLRHRLRMQFRRQILLIRPRNQLLQRKNEDLRKELQKFKIMKKSSRVRKFWPKNIKKTSWVYRRKQRGRPARMKLVLLSKNIWKRAFKLPISNEFSHHRLGDQ